jgi:hypothetical protein
LQAEARWRARSPKAAAEADEAWEGQGEEDYYDDVPEDLRCPITTCLMLDPVIAQ